MATKFEELYAMDSIHTIELIKREPPDKSIIIVWFYRDEKKTDEKEASIVHIIDDTVENIAEKIINEIKKHLEDIGNIHEE